MDLGWFDSIQWVATGMHVLVAVLFLFSIASNFLPVVSGPLVAWLAILIHRLALGHESVTWTFVLIGAVLVIISQALDALCTWWGAKRFGATWKGALGAVIGGIAGAIFFNIPGMIIGPIVGAFVFEWIESRKSKQAVHAGIGAVLGGLAAGVIKMGMTFGLILAFYFLLP